MAINSMNSVSHGLSGLVSGMDSQSMVDAMLAGTQAKIDKQKANKTILNYRRDTYRNTIKSLTAFQNNFFSFSSGSSSSNNMLSSSFYNSMMAATKSSAFKVTAGSTANAGKTTVNSIQRLAQSLKLKSMLTETTAKVEGKLDLDKLKADGGEIQIQLDGVMKTIKLPPVTPLDTTLPPNDLDLARERQQKKFETDLNEAIKHTFGNGVKAEVSGGKISFIPSDPSREFQIIGNADAMAVLGMKTGISNKINDRMRMQDINFAQPLNGESFKFNINGVEFSVGADESLSSVIGKINNSDANVKIRYSSIEDKFSIESTVSGEGTQIKMSQSEGNLLTAMFGIGSGGNVTGKTQYAYAGGLDGRVPGLADNETGETEINDAIAKMDQNLDTFIATNRGSFFLNVNGEDVEVKLTDPPQAGGKYTIEDVIKAVDENATLDAKGIKLKKVLTTADRKPTGAIELSANKGVKVVAGNGMGLMGISGSNEKVATKENTLEQLGMGSLVINVDGTERTFSASEKLSQVMAFMETAASDKMIDAAKLTNPGLTFAEEMMIREKVSIQVLEAPPGSEGKIRMFGIDIPMDISISGDDKKLFGTDKLLLNSGNNADGTINPSGFNLEQVTAGQNAVVYINGERVERNSNEFTVSGLSFELKETFNTAYDPNDPATNDTTKYENVDVTRDTDKIFNGVVKFMEEYNKLVDKTWALLKEDANYRDYPPLTDKQKEGMSEKEIELWDAKSKEGLLRGDDNLEAIMDTMRQVLSYRPAGSKYSLADMGLTTGYDMETGIGGKLIFNDQNGTGEKLRNIIAQEPEALEKLFTDSENGIMVELNKVITGATTGASKSNPKYTKLSLVELSGKSSSDTSSRMYKEGRAIDENLANLQRKYKAEYARYWKQFNAMEQMIQQMNQQSSWLTQQMSG